MPDALIVGAGQIGAAIAERLLADGWHVRIATRGRHPLPPQLADNVVPLVIDHDLPDGIASAIGQGADAVIDTIAYDEADASRLLASRSSVGAYVVISSASVYADAAGRSLDRSQGRGFPELPVPVPEAQATVPPGADTYAARKVALERRLLDSGATVAVLRPCAVHGPHARDPREWWFVKRLLDGRPRIPLAFAGASTFHTSATVNIAALVGTVLASPGTHVLNAVDPDAPTAAAIGQAIMRAIGRSAELAPMAELAGTPWSVPRPFVLSDAAARAIGYRPVTGYAGGAVAACRWLADTVPTDGWDKVLTGLAKYPYGLFDYAAENDWLNRR
jgi:nucleoside-diphosphate-sugar epimerase